MLCSPGSPHTPIIWQTYAGALSASPTEDSFTEGSSAAPSAELSGLWTDTSSGGLPGPVVGRLVTAAADKLALGDTSPTGAARPVNTRPAPACPCLGEEGTCLLLFGGGGH